MCPRSGGLFTKRIRPVVFACLALSGAGIGNLIAFEYSIEGKLDYFVGDPSSNVLSREFKLVVSNCLWSVRVSAPDVASIRYYEAMCDGSSIYSYTALNTQDTNFVAANTGVAVMDSGIVPPENGTFANYIWAGLASGCYFGTAKKTELAPLWHGQNAHTTTVKANWGLLDGSPSLPEHVEYFDTGSEARPSFEWKRAELNVVLATNVGTFAEFGRTTFPLKFTYEGYGLKSNAQSHNDTKRTHQVVVEVRSITLGLPTPTERPKATGATFVEERRIPQRPGVEPVAVYLTSQPQLPSVPEKSAYQNQRQIEVTHGPSKGIRILITATILLGSAALAFALLHQKGRK